MSDMKCLGCKYFETKLCYRCDSCYDQFEPIETPRLTNADRIRAMTDEELTEYIRVFFPEVCPPGNCPGEDYCYNCWLDWLKQEVEDET